MNKPFIISSIISMILILFLFLTTMQSIAFQQEEQQQQNVFSNTRTGTITRTNTELPFSYTDEADDVFLTDHRIEIYTETEGFDIKNITSKEFEDRLWLNMSMYDYIYNDENIYYKMMVADAEIIMYKGEGEIIYSDSSNNLVYLSDKTLSADIDLNKLSFDIFSISGEVYWEDNNASLGDYRIYDTVAIDASNFDNYIELEYMDPQDDVKIEYTLTSEVSEASEMDIISTELRDDGDLVTITITCKDNIKTAKEYKYTISIGNAKFELSAGTGSLKYLSAPAQNANFKITNSSLSTSFDKRNFVFPPNYFEVITFYNPTELKSYVDKHGNILPKYLFDNDEYLDLSVSLIENNSVVMTLHGELGSTQSELVRSFADEMGNNNGQVEDSEVELLITELKKDFSTSNFFEFYPQVDSIPGFSNIEFEFENILGNNSNPINIRNSIIGRWQFTMVSQNTHEIVFRFLPADVQSHIGSDYFFDFSYNTVSIKLSDSDDFKGWQFTTDSESPALITKYLDLDVEHSIITIPSFEYYVLKNQITTQQFGFSIELNETLVGDGDDNGKSDKDKDNDSGFLPGFETLMIITAISATIIYFKGKGKNTRL